MGQANSSEASSGPLENEDARVKLSPELEKQIALDFQNESIDEAWRGVKVAMLKRRNQREQALKESVAQQNAAVQGELQRLQARHAQLDQSIDQLKKEFDDQLMSLQYDTQALTDKLDAKLLQAGGETSLPCLGPRAHWMDCQKKYAVDSRPCDAYLATLERCVTQAIVKDV